MPWPVLTDEVLAHTSDEHRWFCAESEARWRQRRLVCLGQSKIDGTVPNNWLSTAGAAQTNQSALSPPFRLSRNHGCSSDVWARTSSVMTLNPRACASVSAIEIRLRSVIGMNTVRNPKRHSPSRGWAKDGSAKARSHPHRARLQVIELRKQAGEIAPCPSPFPSQKLRM